MSAKHTHVMVTRAETRRTEHATPPFDEVEVACMQGDLTCSLEMIAYARQAKARIAELEAELAELKRHKQDEDFDNPMLSSFHDRSRQRPEGGAK